MKYVIIVMLCFTTICEVSGQSTEKACIEVRGMAKVEKTIKTYILDILITEELSYSEEKRSLEDIKKVFFDRAKAAGFDSSRFTEDKLTYALTQYGAGGSFYSFQTSDPGEVVKFNNLIIDKTGTVSIMARRVTYLPAKDFSKIIAAAVADGKGRAEKLATALGKKLGALQTIIDYSTSNDEGEETVYYQPKEDRYYYLSLKYLVE
ncbi:hypothetical protein [Sphingobacterium spiritivorum]|uniref:hypothetical protein n=1 Tax=Sphingobacterium spiritivorum TaxID=258 RepID=UPI001918CC5A|nr:hypothetical protein [Sphingobacterium spiritivorum]QQT26114.1 hypothetical protein I6J02_20840 [Sphingobacterium spiritivorum]